ncbi:MAG: glycosyltransferase family 2 protein [Chloroflexota bacterium]
MPIRNSHTATGRNKLRFLGLGALTAATIGATTATVLSMQGPDKVPPVDALTTDPPGGGEWPFVSIIVPARNEERNLPKLLPTLLSQHYPHYEVIVIDDQSTDATPHILAEWAARDPRLHVIMGEDLRKDEGWMGKPHAMMQGARIARGEWLLFTDADTQHEPLSLGSSIAYAIKHKVDLFTIAPTMEIVSPSEKLIMPIATMGISFLYPFYKVNDPKSSIAIANGQYIMVRRDVYDAVGGVERVKSKIAEDLEFGKAVKSDGYKLHLADGRHIMSVRMYTNFQEVWEGWSKNVVLSMKGNPLQAVLSVTGVFSIVGLPFVLVRWVSRLWKAANSTGNAQDKIAAGWATAISSWFLALPLVYRFRIDQALGLSPLWTLTMPVGVATFGVLMLSSLIRILTGKGVTWKGRTYADK